MRVHSPGTVVTNLKRKVLLVGCAGFVLSMSSNTVQANPDGPDVVGGSIAINGLGTSQVDITQSTSRGAINWNSFSIGAGETTRFIQPDSNSITLNRVTGADPSQILGTMTANGKIILINGNGILFGKDAKVDAAGLVATTHDIDNDAFMSGAPMHFIAGAHEIPGASVVNEGQITIHGAGVAAFVAPQVRNSGLIQADMGKVALGAGKGFTLDFYGDDLISFGVDDNISSTLTAADGTPLRALVENDGLIKAAGGSIVLTAATAREVVNQAVHVTGTVSADSVSNKGGQIILGGASSGIVNVDHAQISAKGKTGGSIKVLSDQVAVTGSSLDASGENGGGTVRVGGGYHGGEDLQRARTVVFDASSTAKADSTVDGDGGSVVLWSDVGTQFDGHISARGEGEGQGGSAEVSSAGMLAYNGTADLRATSGKTGTLLLDPEDITISTGTTSNISCSAGACTATGNSSILNVTTLQNALATSNVMVSTGAVGAQSGNIVVANNITWATGNLLTLSAAANITINSGVTVSNTYTGTFTAGTIPVVLAMRADNAGANNSSNVTNNGTINMSGSTGAVSIYYDANMTPVAGTQTANGSWVAPADGSVSGQFTSYKLVNTVADLAAISTGLSANYALGNNIVGSGIFNSNAPITGPFTGILDGQYGKLTGGANYSITGLTLTTAANLANVGLFGSIGAAGKVRNLGLGLAVTATGSNNTATYVGTLAGINNGLIANVTATGAVGYTFTAASNIAGTASLGGLVGQNTSSTGQIINSTASGNVTYTQSGTTTGTSIAYLGGLIGQNSSTAVISVSGSSASGNVTGLYGSGTSKTGSNFGGLIGINNAATTISASSYTGTLVTSSLITGASEYIGGLIGNNSVAGGIITGSNSTGAVSYTGAGTTAASVGGLVGNNVGTITGSNAGGTAGFTGASTGGGNIGGLAGVNSGTITNSYATGNSSYASTGASGAGSVGGLVGTNSGTVQGTGVLYSYSTGTPTLGSSVVTASFMGGLVGTNSGTILQAYSNGVSILYSGMITTHIGGLVGTNTGTVGDSAALTDTTSSNNTVSITGTPNAALAPTYNVGGLIGSVTGTGRVYNAAATGDVTFSYSGTSTGNLSAQVGGLIGSNGSTYVTSVTSSSYAGNVLAKYSPTFTGTVTNYIGGLVGVVSGATETTGSTASGSVTNGLNGNSSSEYTGGLIGYLNSATASITNSNATNSVVYNGAGSPSIGGLVGYSKGTIKNSYSANGTITLTGPNTTSIGGLVGQSTGTIGDSAASSATTYSNSTIVVNANPSGTTASTYSIGNLVGTSSGTIINTTTGGDVTFNYAGTTASGTTTVQIGGLVGANTSTSTTSITASTASNTVTAKVDPTATGAKIITAYVGGLEGVASGAAGVVSGVSSSATVNSSVANGTIYVGGLAGYISTATTGITNSFATGTVTNSGTTASSVGGLVGYNKGIIQGTGGLYSYATGAVNVSGISTGTTNIGGLVGLNNLTIKQAYSANGTITYTGGGTINMGGLVGQSTAGVIGDAAASTPTTYSNTALILNAAPTATATYTEGNLVGLLAGSTGAVINVTTGADVAFNYAGTAGTNIAYIGGLIGQNSSTAATSASFATATNAVTADYAPTFSGVVTLSEGGFAGYLTGITTMTGISATGAVSSNLAGTLISMGGLVGTTAVATGTLTNSFSTGNVTYSGVGATAVNVGGLVGKNQGIIQGSGAGNYSYATGDVKVTNASTTTGYTVNLGGLAGTSNATVKQAYSQGGDVQYTGATATANVGGLIGQVTAGSVGDASAITQTTYTDENVTATVTPTGSAVTTTSVGGLVGSVATVVTGSIIYSKATGDVSYIYRGTSSGTSNAYLGGILGSQTNTAATGLSYSYSMGAVSAAYAGGFTGTINVAAGGAVGYVNGLTARQSIWSSSTVTDALNTGTQYLGGLVGANNSTGVTSDSYAVGAVKYTGVSSVAEGGLIGYNKGNVNQSYATGYVMNTGAGVGGLIGSNISGTVTDGYWDTGTTGQATSAAGTGVTTATMQTALQGSFSTSTWGIVSGETNPYLKWQFATGTPQAISGTAYSDLGVTALGNVSVGTVSNGTPVSSVLTKDGYAVTGANGYYYFLVAPTTLATSNGKVMTYLTGATKANTVIDTANNASGSATGLDLFATYLHEYSASTTTSGMVAGLGTALGGNTGANFLYTFSGGVTTLKTGTNIAVDGTGASLLINQALGSPGGNVYIRNNGAVTQSAAITATKLVLGGTGAYTLTNASNAVDTLAGNAASISLKDSNAVTIDTVDGIVGTTTTGASQIVSTGGITLNQSMIAGGAGTSILLAGTGFTNNAGASALTTGAGKFQVWSADPSADMRGGLGYDFKQYNSTYGTTTVLGTGNGFFYTTAPTLTAALNGITKVYDGNITASVTGATQNVTGAIDGDTAALSLSGATGTYSDKNAATGKTVTVSGATIGATTNGSATVYGYQLIQPTSITGEITKASLTISGAIAADKVYDTTTTATLGGTAVLSGKVSGDTVNLATGSATGSFADKNVGIAKAVTANGYTISGADAGNYNLTQPTGLTANISQAALTLIGLSASNKVYDATTAASLTGTAALSGNLGSDTVAFGGTGVGTFADKNVANGKAVTVTGYTISGADAGNYAFVQPTGLTANITPASLTLSGLSASNKVYDTLTTATLTGTAALSGKLGSDVVTLGGTGAGTFVDKNVANGKAVTVTGYSVSGTDAGNYTFVQPTGLTANITPAALTLSGLSASNKVYDTTTTATLTGTAALSGKLGSDTVIVGGTGTGSFTDKNVANGKAVAVTGYSVSGADAGNYTFTQPTGLTANITPASLSVSGLAASGKVYDSTTAATLTGTAALSGKLAGDTVTLGGTGVGAFADKNVGVGKAITVTGYSVSGGDAANYTLSQPTGLTATITQAALTLSGLNASNKVYDSTATATLTGTAALSGKFAGDTVTLGGTGSGTFSDKNVANGKSVTVAGYSISGTDAANYSFTEPTGLTANITPASLLISGLSTSNKVYDATTAATLTGTAALSGKFAGDTVTLGGTGSGTFSDKNVANGKSVTVAGYSISGTDAANYTLSQPTGLSANITPAALTLSGLGASNKVYDATTAATLIGTAALSGKLGGDVVTFGGTGIGVFADKNVANGKTVSVTGYSISGTDAGNYIFAQPTGLFANITPASLTLSGLSASNKVYDTLTTATLTGTAALSGKLGSDVVTFSGTGAGSFADKNVANGKAVTVTGYSISGADATNYSFVQPTGLTANITPAALTLSGLSASNKVYDATTTATLSGTAALSGKLGSDVVTIGGTGAGTFGDKNVAGGKTVTVTGYTVGGTDAGNYTFTQPTGLTANITPANLSISGVTASNKVYDSLLTATLGGAAILNGKLGSDTVTLGGTAAGAFADKNVGTAKTVTVTGYSVSGADATNYILSQPTGLSANITPASIVVTNISANNKVYDGLTTGTVSGAAALLGKKSGDTVTLSGAGATYNFDDKNVGASKNLNVSGYTIGGTDATNYILSQPTGLVADITPAALSLSGIGVLGKTYDATTVATLSGTASITGKVSGDTVTLSTAGATGSFSDKNAGVGKAVTVSGYAIGGADAGNYTLNQPSGLTATITQAALTLSGLSASNKIYDATNAATLTGMAALSGKFGGDTVTIGGTGAAIFSDKNVANGKAVAVTGYTISGADAANYAFTQPSGLTANITPAALTLSGLAAANKVYDTNTVATITGTAALSGKLGSDVVTIGGTGAGTFSDKNVANAKSVTVSGYTISGMDAGNYAFSQPVGLTANITPAALSVAGLTGVDKVYDAGLGAALGGTATLSGMLSGDAVTLGGAGAGVFANKNVGSNKAITVTGYSISGTDAGNYVFAQPTGVTANITPASLSIGGIAANNKVYDSTLAATLTGTALVQGKMSGDSVTLGGTVSSVFLDKNAGTGKAVAVTGYTIAGLDAGNYTLSQPSSLTADITAATLSINGVVVNNKVYDGNTTASLSGTAALQGLFSGDLINLAAGGVSASFNDKNVANGKTVTVNGYNISGTDVGNYNLTQPTGLTANITPAFLTVAGINAVNKVYDSTVAAELNGAAALSGLVSGDNVSLGGTANASFANKNVGTSKVVTVLGYNITGGDAGNYNFTQPTGLSANITPATLGITGVSANDKVYDGTAVATLQVSGTSLTGKYAGDAVTLVTGSVSGAFADKDAGTGKVVLVSGFNITGGDAGNYALLPAGSVVANITPKALSVGGTFTVNNKVYDETTDATILLNNLSLSGIIGSDGVTLLPSLAFADPAIGAGKTVSIKGASSLGGARAANYTLLLTGAPTALATIITNAPPVTTAEAQTTTAIISTQPKFAVSAAQFSATPAPVLMSFAPSPAAGSTGSSSGTTASSASGSTKSKDTTDEGASSSGFNIISPANASDSAAPEKETKGECAEGQNGGGKNGAAGC